MGWEATLNQGDFPHSLTLVMHDSWCSGLPGHTETRDINHLIDASLELPYLLLLFLYSSLTGMIFLFLLVFFLCFSMYSLQGQFFIMYSFFR